MAKLAALFLIIPSVAFAHPGHGTTDPSSARHYLIEPVHVMIAAAVLLAVVVGVAMFKRSRATKSSRHEK